MYMHIERLIVVSLPSGICRLATRCTRCSSTCTTTRMKSSSRSKATLGVR